MYTMNVNCITFKWDIRALLDLYFFLNSPEFSDQFPSILTMEPSSDHPGPMYSSNASPLLPLQDSYPISDNIGQSPRNKSSIELSYSPSIQILKISQLVTVGVKIRCSVCRNFELNVEHGLFAHFTF